METMNFTVENETQENLGDFPSDVYLWIPNHVFICFLTIGMVSILRYQE